MDIYGEKLLSNIYRILKDKGSSQEYHPNLLLIRVFGVGLNVSKPSRPISYSEFRSRFVDLPTKKIVELLTGLLDDVVFWEHISDDRFYQRNDLLLILVEHKRHTDNMEILQKNAEELTIIKNAVQTTNDIIELFKDVDNSKNDVLEQLKKLNDRLDKLETTMKG